jgi:hypothetical protein
LLAALMQPPHGPFHTKGLSRTLADNFPHQVACVVRGSVRAACTLRFLSSCSVSSDWMRATALEWRSSHPKRLCVEAAAIRQHR